MQTRQVRKKGIVGGSAGGGQGVVGGGGEVYWDAVLDVLRRNCTLELQNLMSVFPPVNMAARFWDTVAGCGGGGGGGGGSGSLRTLTLRGFIEDPIAGRFLMYLIGPLKALERLGLNFSTLIYPLRHSTNNNQQQGQDPVWFVTIKTLHLITNSEGYQHPTHQRFIF